MIWVWVSLHCYSAPRICCFAVTQPSRRCALLLLPDPFSFRLRPGCTKDTASRETAACPPMICAVGWDYMPMSVCLFWGWLVLVLFWILYSSICSPRAYPDLVRAPSRFLVSDDCQVIRVSVMVWNAFGDASISLWNQYLPTCESGVRAI